MLSRDHGDAHLATTTENQMPSSSTTSSRRFGARCAAARVASAVTVAACLALGFAANGDAAIKFTSVGGSAAAPDGQRVTQAGAHPDVTTSFSFETVTKQDATGTWYEVPRESVKNVTVDLPAGLVGSPARFAECSAFQLTANEQGLQPLCPVFSQIGTVTVCAVRFGGCSPFQLFNLTAARGTAAQFGANAMGSVIIISARVRPDGGYAIAADSENSSQGINLERVEVTLWGVPGDPAHDAERAGLKMERVPLMTIPTSCSGQPLKTTIRADSWDTPGVFDTVSFDRDFNGEPLMTTGCDRLVFNPTVASAPTTTQADAPSGLDVDIESPQNLDNPDGLASPQLRDVTMTFPPGVSVSPSSADGLQVCSDAQIGFKTDRAITCPDGAKIGTVTASTPVLKETLSGALYLRTQNSDDPESGEMFRVVLVLSNPERGLLIKLPGSIVADKSTGQLKATFADNPQMPVSKISLKLKSGARGPLATAPTCGSANATTALTSWAGGTVNVDSPVATVCPGVQGFAPTFAAGATNPVAGDRSPFVVRFTRDDRQEYLGGVTLDMPGGLLAKLKGVTLCGDDDAAAGTCPAGSRVGSAVVGAGPGANPFFLKNQPVYLTGPYKGAPYGLAVVTRAAAGPFDLGQVIVRQKITVDPTDAHVTVVSDPLPTILKGVPLRLRSVEVSVDRPGFMLNPTSCETKSIAGVLSSVAGTNASRSARFQVGECASLGYTPKLAMTMTGKGQTKDGSHPTLTARLTPPPGDANSKKVTVTLPLSLALDPGNANGLCEPVDAARNQCPAKSIVGSAQAQSILPDTLKAPVYFVRGERIENGKVRKTLPKLFIPLTANGVTVNVWGDSNVENDRLVTTFANLPDAPFSTFDLTVNGGKHGILAVSGANTCAATQVADARYEGQNAKTYTSNVTMGTPCTLGVVKSSHTSTALKLTVGGLGAGKVSASGNGVTKSSRTLTGATTATLSLKLSKATRRALARGRDVKVKVRVAFTANGQKKAKTATKTVVLHGAKKR
jgi:hypothetical protein